MSKRRKSSPRPIPESINSCGDWKVPALTITSDLAATVLNSLPIFVLYAGRALAGEQDPPRTRAGDHLQIRSVQMRMDVGARRAAALAVLLRDRKGAKAFLALAVEIVGRRQLQLAAGVEKALLEWIR